MPSVAIIGTRGYPSYYGGFETAVRELVPDLADEGWRVTVYSRKGATRAEDPNRDDRIRSVETPGIERKSLSTLSYGLTAVLHAAKERPDVALVMNVANGFWLPILRLAGIPTLVNVDGIEWDRAKWGRFAKWVFRSGAKWTARFGTQLVFDSHEIGRRWMQDFSRNGAYIPYGGQFVEHDLPLEDGLAHRSYVLMVARFVPENTVQEFFEAVPLLAQEYDVVIVGSSGYGGAFDDQARELSARHGRVRWLGHVSDDARLFSLWQHAGVYFHGHSVGGTNPALVQAMALGAPVVARDTVYTREVLANGALFVRPTAVDIVDAIRELASDGVKQEAFSLSNVTRAREQYSWRSVNSGYLRELSTLIGVTR
ncbi:glycosyltransferase [Demequina salsinemoris]|uniref:glycosyltransferase n=1 Tax=Demequina salsinemoris TaxID=577470 RepID=UPI000783F42B|nr:glycosyltransferase [Demequina salsinemoris]